jgi:hypothetical protein
MARIALDVTPPQLSKAQKLIDAGEYESLQQFAEIAFANQLALEEGADPEKLAEEASARRRNGSKAKHNIPPLPPKGHGQRPVQPTKGTIKHVAMHPNGKVSAQPGPRVDLRDALARLRAINGKEFSLQPVETVATPHDAKLLPLVNKPFALKLVVREVLAASSDGWPRAPGLIDVLGADAAVLGQAIAAEDREAERSRNLLSTGLPVLDKEESIERFVVQYVGRVARSGQVTPGAISQFALASIQGGRVKLTTAGLEFARLANPVFDGERRPWDRLLSPDEQKFVVVHVMRFIPGEATDALAAVDAVRCGNNRPESLLDAVKPALPATWTDVQARSYVSGLVTRLVELDVLSRIWTGRTVHYELAAHAGLVVTNDSAKEVAL